MTRRVTTLLAMFVLFLGVGEALAQDPMDVTIREINTLSQDNIDALNAAGSNYELPSNTADCENPAFSDLCDAYVRVTAVVVSDPLNSGLATPDNDGLPGRIHVFIRDTAADTEGVEGMGTQLVDGSGLGLETLVIGDEITVVGTVEPFDGTMQIVPESFTIDGARDTSDPIFDPITITTSDLNKSVGADGAVTANWENMADYRSNYVRIEGATVTRRDAANDRVDFAWSDDDGTTSVAMYDTSLRFRNDRNDTYSDTYNVREDDFVPPPIGATINIQGFVTFTVGPGGDPFAFGVPNGSLLALNPMEDSDLEVTASPPSIAHTRPTVVPNTTDGVQLTATITPDPSRTITSTEAVFTTTSNQTPQMVAGVAGADDEYAFDIDGSDLADGDFITYHFTAEDNTGASSESVSFSLKVVDGMITMIAQLQETADGGVGNSPFAGFTLDTDITATVQLSPETGFLVLQDDAAAWSGIFIESVGSNTELTSLSVGDVINITSVEVYEGFGVTYLDAESIVFTTESTGGDPIAPVTITTDVLTDLAVAEAYEGVTLRFEGPFIADNDRGFGEFMISSDGTVENGLLLDDASNLFPGGFDPSAEFETGAQHEFVEAPLWFSFDDFKLLPESLDKIGPAIDTAVEDDAVPASFTLDQNYPNPFNPSTKIEFDVSSAGVATLAVFDILGRKVRTLVDGQVSVGAQSVTFDAAGLPSGVYIYRLSAGANTQTRKMLLMK